jgi:hypothetical protein
VYQLYCEYACGEELFFIYEYIFIPFEEEYVRILFFFLRGVFIHTFLKGVCMHTFLVCICTPRFN